MNSLKTHWEFEKLKVVFVALVIAFFSFSYCVEAIYDNNQSNNLKTVNVDVLEVKDEIKILFVKIDSPNDFENFSLNSSVFLNKLFPIRDGGVNRIVSPKIINSSDFFIEHGYENYNSIESVGHKARRRLIKELDSFSRLENVDYVIGITPSGWFDNFIGVPNGALGETYFYVRSALVTNDYIDTVSHEISHTNPINLCDEYNATVWSIQNNQLSILGFGGCSNAENGSSIDFNCLGNGCETETIGRIAGFDNDTFITLHSIMGDMVYPDTWASGETYNRTVKKLNVSYNKNLKKVLLIAGTVFKNGSAELSNSYIIDEGFETCQEEIVEGNISVDLKINDSTYHSINFTPFYTSYTKLNQTNGSVIELNETYFLFTLPFNESLSKIEVKENSSVKVERNVTPNTPSINITYPTGGESLGESFNVTWNASDADGDDIYYAVLVSGDGGGEYTTLDIDLNQTYYEVDPGDFTPGANYTVKVLATDGVNTGSDESLSFTLGPFVSDLAALHSSGKDVVVEFIVNNRGVDAADLNWTVNTSEEAIAATEVVSLDVNESVFVLAGFNYTSPGTYEMTATALENTTEKGLESITLTINNLSVDDLARLYAGEPNAFTFSIYDNTGSAIEDVGWSCDMNDSTVIQSTENMTVGNVSYVIFQHNYSSAGNYTVNCSSSNSLLTDHEIIEISVA